MARPTEYIDGKLHSVYFPSKLLKHYKQLAAKQSISFSKVIVNTLEKNLPNLPQSLPDESFGEYQLD